ncbi:AI-2E family transporter [Inmirania thermothiophila]|uniref:AI-2E family transporter n=1 Tax=Inmirania thermothiophila TaxID=1750597 RepID=UPI000F48C0EC
MEYLRRWYRRHFSDPEAFILAFLLVAGFGLVAAFGRMLAPVIAALVIAYLLEGLVSPLERILRRRLPAVIVVYLAFLALVALVLFGLLPLLSRQVTELVQDLPQMINRGQQALLQLPQHYPQVVTEEQMRELIAQVRGELVGFGQRLLSYSVASLVGIITVGVYLILVPLMVFFFLKDKHRILAWVRGYLPRDRGLAHRVWRDVDVQIGNYVRGKFWEILIVWFATYLTFTLMDLRFAMLLGLMVGLSVLVPYVGAVVATLPVALVAWSQFGWSAEFAYVLAAYGVIQALDGNLLVPLLFSEAVNLHPIAIIVAVLFFGGLWGFWGVFFAIPLATLVAAVLRAWPRREDAGAAAPA